MKVKIVTLITAPISGMNVSTISGSANRIAMGKTKM